jgi:ABC-type multidrug transport system ATPase subunit
MKSQWQFLKALTRYRGDSRKNAEIRWCSHWTRSQNHTGQPRKQLSCHYQVTTRANDQASCIIHEVIEAEGLSKRYRGRKFEALALSDFSLHVDEGQAVALLGPNGAGKSTVVGILATLVRPDAGRAFIAGFELSKRPAQVRQTIGLVQQDSSLYSAARVRQILILHARLFGLSPEAAGRRVDELIELALLQDVTELKVRQLSGGMRRRLDICLSLVHNPPVLLLDEATSSLDPVSRRELWNEFARLRDNGTCILLATQDTEETERLADWVGVLANGELQQVLPPSSVRAMAG